MLLFAFLALTVQKTQLLFPNERVTKQKKGFGYVNHAPCMRQNLKNVHDRCPFDIKLGIFVCSLEVCRAS